MNNALQYIRYSTSIKLNPSITGTRVVYVNETTSTGLINQSYDEKYRTIIFDSLPSEDLLTWLQANATPI